MVNQNHNSWSLPKGHIDAGETPLQAAQREVLEESGISELTLIRDLGEYERYKIGLDGKDDRSELKVMHFFLFKTTQQDLKPQDAHNPEARWVPKSGVADLLTHSKDKEFFLKVVPQI